MQSAALQATFPSIFIAFAELCKLTIRFMISHIYYLEQSQINNSFPFITLFHLPVDIVVEKGEIVS